MNQFKLSLYDCSVSVLKNVFKNTAHIVPACNFHAVILEHSDMLIIYPHSIHGMSEVSHSPGANKSQSNIDLLTETDESF